MDADRFDRIVRSLETGTPRRRLFGAIVGGIAAMLGGEFQDEANAATRRRSCPSGATRC